MGDRMGGGGGGEHKTDLFHGIIIALAPVLVLAMLIFFGYWLYRRHRLRTFRTKHQQGMNGAGPCAGGVSMEALGSNGHMSNGYLPSGPPPSAYTRSANSLPIRLLEVKAKGRFGVIWHGLLSGPDGANTEVAVKVFPPGDVESWVQEQEIYALSTLRSHPNILHFLGAEVRGGHPPNFAGDGEHLPNQQMGSPLEYWIVTIYQPHGSLYDYIKSNTLTEQESLRLGISMLRGLAYLHEEVSGPDQKYKPTIVHRDFKSRNVLVRKDMTACIADFGLALKCEHGQTPENTHGQVGTRRYMAPEVLEGATEFSAFAFRQIDVYAAALVLWEILTRTKQSPNGEPGEYRLPFEVEVGLQPSLQEMQFCVLTNQVRPRIPAIWTDDPNWSMLCATIEEMWDSEPEARLTAGCALERLSALMSALQERQHQKPDQPHTAPQMLGGAPAPPHRPADLPQLLNNLDGEAEPLLLKFTPSETTSSISTGVGATGLEVGAPAPPYYAMT